MKLTNQQINEVLNEVAFTLEDKSYPSHDNFLKAQGMLEALSLITGESYTFNVNLLDIKPCEFSIGEYHRTFNYISGKYE